MQLGPIIMNLPISFKKLAVKVTPRPDGAAPWRLIIIDQLFT